MVYVYRNFLIVDREEKMEKATELVRYLGAQFNDAERIWHAKSPQDKVVLVYQNPLIDDRRIHTFHRHEDIRFQLNEYLGYMHVYCQGQNIKIDKFKISMKLVDQEPYWRAYKDYLCETIRQAGVQPMQLATTQYVLHWGRLTNPVIEFMHRVGLLANKSNKTYVFKPSDLQPTGFSSFGNNTFANNWGINWSSLQQSTFPISSFQTPNGFGK